MAPTIRRGEASDAPALAALAARTFHETFAADNNPDDLALYMGQAYGSEQQRAELDDSRIDTLLVESDDALIAYAMLRDEPPPDCVAGPRPIELWRFYVDRAWHGRGIAQRLMAAVEDEARAHRAQTIWLGVWERNLRAQAFYRKCGFVDVGSHVFVVGSDPQIDRIFERAL
jgi:ribosomal protein S18 acetylase RimI-like enzyme